MMRDLSRLPESSIFGLEQDQHYLGACPLIPSAYFSNEVAKLVTHPLWPTRVPRITSCSAMLG